MFEISAKMQDFISNDCDMDDELARNIVKEFGGEIEFVKKYDGYAKRGINYDTPHFSDKRLMPKVYEDNKVNVLIWTQVHASHEGYESKVTWLEELNDTCGSYSTDELYAGMLDSNSKAHADVATAIMMTLAYQLCRQYKEFITDYEDA